MKTDHTGIPSEIKSSFTSKLNLIQQAFVLEEIEMGQKEKLIHKKGKIVNIYQKIQGALRAR